MLAVSAESAATVLAEREDEADEPVETLGGDELEEAEHSALAHRYGITRSRR